MINYSMWLNNYPSVPLNYQLEHRGTLNFYGRNLQLALCYCDCSSVKTALGCKATCCCHEFATLT